MLGVSKDELRPLLSDLFMFFSVWISFDPMTLRFKVYYFVIHPSVV